AAGGAGRWEGRAAAGQGGPSGGTGGRSTRALTPPLLVQLLLEPERFRLRLALLRVVPEDERDGGAWRDAGGAVLALRHVEEERLAVAVPHESEALVGEEAIDHSLDARATRCGEGRMGEDLEAGRERSIRRRRRHGGGMLEGLDAP